MGDIGVAQEDHFALDIRLSGCEFRAKFVPIPLEAVFQKGLAVLVDAHAGSESLGILQDGTSDVLHFLDLLALNEQEAVADERAEPERNEDAIRGGFVGDGTLELVVGQRAERVERIENLADRGCGEIIDPEFLPDMLVADEVLGNLRGIRFGGRIHSGVLHDLGTVCRLSGAGLSASILSAQVQAKTCQKDRSEERAEDTEGAEAGHGTHGRAVGTFAGTLGVIMTERQLCFCGGPGGRQDGCDGFAP